MVFDCRCQWNWFLRPDCLTANTFVLNEQVVRCRARHSHDSWRIRVSSGEMNRPQLHGLLQSGYSLLARACYSVESTAMFHSNNNELSLYVEGPHDALCQLKSWKLLHSCTKKSHMQKVGNGWVTLKVTRGHRNCRYSIGHLSLHNF